MPSSETSIKPSTSSPNPFLLSWQCLEVQLQVAPGLVDLIVADYIIVRTL